ncbi:uncharacterized protein Dsimw501_GD27408 [Drosophila simulans]|uniref:Uncharacterized protein n=1 Tax=Drosophila simulans TaxID=7240 RepID=A0A0J9QWP0_DROSI|nr:uncharacterized protein Dsimw501_GD27408 [Drosophila simulans]
MLSMLIYRLPAAPADIEQLASPRSSHLSCELTTSLARLRRLTVTTTKSGIPLPKTDRQRIQLRRQDPQRPNSKKTPECRNAIPLLGARSQHQQLQQQQQSLAMPPPPPPPYNVPPLGSIYSHHQGTAGSRHLNHMHGKTTGPQERWFPDCHPATKQQMQSGS